MKKLFLGIFASILTIAYLPVYGADTNGAKQDVTLSMTETALISVSTSVGLGVGASATSTAGEALSTSAENETTRLKISTAKDGVATRAITIQVNKDPGTEANVTLTAQALAPNSNFNTTHGSSGTLSTQTLGTTAKDLITGISGICWSGTTSDDGYKIKYGFTVLDSKTLKNSVFEVTYTLIEK
jgi:hypothetical protein